MLTVLEARKPRLKCWWAGHPSVKDLVPCLQKAPTHCVLMVRDPSWLFEVPFYDSINTINYLPKAPSASILTLGKGRVSTSTFCGSIATQTVSGPLSLECTHHGNLYAGQHFIPTSISCENKVFSLEKILLKVLQLCGNLSIHIGTQQRH